MLYNFTVAGLSLDFRIIPLLGGADGRTKAYAGGGVFVLFNDEPRGEIPGEGEGTDGDGQRKPQRMRC